MWDWMQTHSGALSVALNSAMLVVWMAYLQVFYISFRRANRAVIHIGAAVEHDDDARCLVANMGSEAVYLLGIKVQLDCGQDRYATWVSDRVHDDAPLGGNLRARTNQGPLSGGEALDIGSFRKICERATDSMAGPLGPEDCNGIEITVVVAAQQAHRLMGGSKRFEIAHDSGRLRFRARDVLTRQITAPRERRALMREIAA